MIFPIVACPSLTCSSRPLLIHTTLLDEGDQLGNRLLLYHTNRLVNIPKYYLCVSLCVLEIRYAPK